MNTIIALNAIWTVLNAVIFGAFAREVWIRLNAMWQHRAADKANRKTREELEAHYGNQV